MLDPVIGYLVGKVPSVLEAIDRGIASVALGERKVTEDVEGIRVTAYTISMQNTLRIDIRALPKKEGV